MIFNLFKSELNFKEHPDILNYLIVEEAEQQWNYHLKEGLTKEDPWMASKLNKPIETTESSIHEIDDHDETTE